MNTKAIQKPYVSDTLIIAGVSALSYGIAHLVEASYLSYFGVPSILAEVSIQRFLHAIIVTLLGIIPCIIVIEALANALGYIFSFTVSIIASLIIVGIGIIEIVSPDTLNYNFSSPYVNLVIGIFSLIGFGYLFLKRGVRKYFSFNKNSVFLALIKHSGILRFFASHPLGTLFSLYFFFLLLPIFCAFTGNFYAEVRNEFLVTTINSKQYALLRSYDKLSIYVSTEKEWVNLYDSIDVIGKEYVLLYNNKDLPPYTIKKIIKKEQQP